jgi:hypothetical protein
VAWGADRQVTDFLGVDLGIANVAADSDGEVHSGKDVEDTRRKHNPDGRSANSTTSWRTRRNWRVFRSRPWIPETPVARVPNAVIAEHPTGRANPSLFARHAAIGPMPTKTPPGISGLGPLLSGP